MIKANNAFTDKKYSLAIKYYSEAIKKNPDNINLLHNYIKSLLLSPEININLVIESFKKLVSHQKINQILNIKLINQLHDLGMIHTLDKLKKKTVNPLYLAAIYHEDNPNKALDYLNKIHNENKKAEYYILSADINFRLNKYKKSLEDTDHLIDMGHPNPEVFYQRAQSFIKTNQFNKAQKAMEIFELMNILFNSKNIHEKLNMFVKINKKHPFFLNNMNFKTTYIVLLLNANKTDEALKYLRLIDFSHLSFDNKTRLLKTALQVDSEVVISLLFKQHKNSSLSPKTISSNELSLYCQHFFQIGALKQANSVCHSGIKIYPLVAPINYWYSQVLLQQKNIDQSIQFLNLSIKYAPWVNSWRIQLAQIYLTQGKTIEAAEIVQIGVVNNDDALKRFININGLRIINDK
ncbi:MAG: hypothetical protein AB8B80_08550 [Marinicellaceae bacterium]